jgi:hypothetical protein
MADQNHIRPTFDLDKLVTAMQSEINQGAKCINILAPVNVDKTYLVVTSMATHKVTGGMFSVKVKWSVPHSTLERVYYQRGMLGNFVCDKLFLESSDGKRDFIFGMVEPGAATKVLREIAENNAEVAVREIEQEKAHLDKPPSVDPEIEKFQRAMALAEAGPKEDTESSDDWTEDAYKQLWTWMFERWNQSQYYELWARRIGLSPGLEQRMANNDLWFWINALPALAGLELKQKGHPKLSVFAGYADQVVNTTNDDQRRAMENIKRQFFG